MAEPFGRHFVRPSACPSVCPSVRLPQRGQLPVKCDRLLPFRHHLSLLTHSCVPIHRRHPCHLPCRHRHHRHHLAIVATSSIFSSSLSPLLAQSCAPPSVATTATTVFTACSPTPMHTPPSPVARQPHPPFCCSSESDRYRQSRLFVRRSWKSYQQNINAD